MLRELGHRPCSQWTLKFASFFFSFMRQMEDGLIPYMGTVNSGSDVEAFEHNLDQILVKVNEVKLYSLLSSAAKVCFS